MSSPTICAIFGLLAMCAACTPIEPRPSSPDAPAPAEAAPAQSTEAIPAAAQKAQPPLVPERTPALTGLSLEPYFGDTGGKVASDAFKGERWAQAAAAFDALASERGPRSNPSAYLAAVSLHYAGRHAEAAERFAKLAESYPLLGDYHAFFRAASLHALGQHSDALQVASTVSKTGTNAERASELVARIHAERGKTAEALAQLEDHFKLYGRTASLQLFYANTLAKSGKSEEAAREYRRAQSSFPLDAEAKEASKTLDRLLTPLGAATKKRLLPLSPSEQLARGRALFEAHRSEEAIDVLRAAAQSLPEGGAEQCEALYLQGRCWEKLRKRAEAKPLYTRARAACGDTDWHDEILYFGGLTLYRAGHNDDALSFFEALHKKYPDATTNDDALIWEAAIYGERKNPKARKERLETAVKKYPNGDMREEATWLLVWDAYVAGAWKQAATAAARAIEEGVVETGHARGRLAYWLARSQQRAGDTEACRESYAQVLRQHPLSWYAMLAAERLDALAGAGRAAAVIAEARAGAPAAATLTSLATGDLARNESFLRGVELVRMGLDQPARRELRSFRKAAGKDADWLAALLFQATGDANQAWSIAQGRAREFSAHYPAGAWAERWNLAYPMPFGASVTNHAGAARVPVELAYGIMRTESGFDPEVESWANAVGLMQLLVGTAKEMADAGERDRIDRKALQQPDTNVRLGTRFLGRLLSRFGAHPALAAAGYNAGAAPVKKWLQERGDWEIDSFVEAIPFRQTRHYVKSVCGSFAAYAYLRDGKMPRISLTLPK